MKLKLRTTTGEEGGGGAHRLIYRRGTVPSPVLQQSALLGVLSCCLYWNSPIAWIGLCLPRLDLTDTWLASLLPDRATVKTSHVA